MRAMPEPGRGLAWPRLCAGLLMLCLVAHLAADLAWLYQHSVAAETAQAGTLGRPDQTVADPHGEGVLPPLVMPVGWLALVLALWVPLARAIAFVRGPWLHPPAVHHLHS